jgi:formate-dependent nitrite reductase membrane component NrfD
MSEMTWGYLMAIYLFMGGLAGGSMIISALADLFKGDDYEVLSKSGALVCLFSVIVSVVVLLLEIKRFVVQPMVFLNAYRQLPQSMISVGTWILTGLLIISAASCVLWYFGGNWLARKLVSVVGFILGLATTAYTGLVLSYCRGMPFWGSPFLPWLFVVSGTLTGLTMSMLLIPVAATFMPKAFNSFHQLWERRATFVDMISYVEKYCQILTIAEITLLALFVGTTAGTLLSGAMSLWFYTYIIIGLVIPLGIGYYNSKLEHAGKDTAVVIMAVAGQILVLLGGLLLRYVVLTGGQLIF